jgi:hypothetical protein
VKKCSRLFSGISILAVTGSLLFAASGSAAPITVGSPLSASFTQNVETPESYVAAATALGEPGAHAASPVSGTIIRWRLIDGKGTGFELWVLRPTGGGSYVWIDHSSPVAPAGGALETFSANVPISAGDLVALHVPAEGTDAISYLKAPGSQTTFFAPELAAGTEARPAETYANTEYGFNAEVLPPPTIAAISPAEGPTAGGTSVTIAGTNFIEVTSVQFGENPARSFAVTNEGVLTAVAPSGTPGRVPVKVTTVAGSTTSPQPFIYSSVSNLPLESNLLPPLHLNTCKVPNLIGKNLKATKKRLREADCTLGQVVKNRGVTAKNGEIVKQKPKPATVRPAGSKVSVTLG